MITRRAMLSVLIVIAAGARASSAQKPPVHHADPVGVYDLTFDMQGEHIASVLRLTRDKDGRIGGTVDIHGQPTRLDDLVIEGHKLTGKVSVDHGDIVLTLTFDPKGTVSGTYAIGDMGTGKVAGVRRKDG
jgi:hypothetical protein